MNEIHLKTVRKGSFFSLSFSSYTSKCAEVCESYQSIIACEMKFLLSCAIFLDVGLNDHGHRISTNKFAWNEHVECLAKIRPVLPFRSFNNSSNNSWWFIDQTNFHLLSLFSPLSLSLSLSHDSLRFCFPVILFSLVQFPCINLSILAELSISPQQQYRYGSLKVWYYVGFLPSHFSPHTLDLGWFFFDRTGTTTLIGS